MSCLILCGCSTCNFSVKHFNGNIIPMRRRLKTGRTNLCSSCKKVKDRKGRYCSKCHAAYMREWRKFHPLTKEQRFKHNVRSKLNVYIRKGRVKKHPCEVCGDKNSQGHHEDYNKPFEVVWLCQKHHTDHHKMLRALIEV